MRQGISGSGVLWSSPWKYGPLVSFPNRSGRRASDVVETSSEPISSISAPQRWRNSVCGSAKKRSLSVKSNCTAKGIVRSPGDFSQKKLVLTVVKSIVIKRSEFLGALTASVLPATVGSGRSGLRWRRHEQFGEGATVVVVEPTTRIGGLIGAALPARTPTRRFNATAARKRRLYPNPVRPESCFAGSGSSGAGRRIGIWSPRSRPQSSNIGCGRTGIDCCPTGA